MEYGGSILVPGFQSKESEPQLSLWSESVLKGLVSAFEQVGHGGEANTPLVLLRSSEHKR